MRRAEPAGVADAEATAAADWLPTATAKPFPSTAATAPGAAMAQTAELLKPLAVLAARLSWLEETEATAAAKALKAETEATEAAAAPYGKTAVVPPSTALPTIAKASRTGPTKAPRAAAENMASDTQPAPSGAMAAAELTAAKMESGKVPHPGRMA